MSEDDGQRGPKRKFNDKKKYYASKRKRTNQLEPGLMGFLVTCNYNEKRCLMECYDLLNHYADKLGLKGEEAEPVSEEEVEEEEDFEAAFAKEVERMKAKSDTKERDFQQVVTNAKNVLFIRTKLDPDGILAIMEAILSDVKSGTQKGSRHIMRMLPVIGTCKVDLDKLKQLVSSCLAPHFGGPRLESNQPTPSTSGSNDDESTEDTINADVDSTLCTTDPAAVDATPPAIPTAPSPPPRRTFSVDFKTRNNGSLDRHATLREVSAIVQSFDHSNRVEYDDPEFTVAVEVVGKTLCLALLKNYKANKKYNLQQFGGNGANNGGTKTGGTGCNGGTGKVETAEAGDDIGVSEGVKTVPEANGDGDVKKSDSVEKVDDDGEQVDDGEEVGATIKDEFGYRKPTDIDSVD